MLYFTSDWHIGEGQAPNTHSYLRPRPTSQMVKIWMEQCHSLLGASDTLIFVGDVGITLDDLSLLQGLPRCKRVLVLGDKEYASKHFSLKQFTDRNAELGVFDTVVNECVIDVGGRSYFVAHKPTHCHGRGKPGICGHIHGIWRSQKMPDGNPIINVGIDAWGGIVSEAFITHQFDAVTKYYDIEAFPADW